MSGHGPYPEAELKLPAGDWVLQGRIQVWAPTPPKAPEPKSKCGTNAGYVAHMTARKADPSVTACAPCKRAHADRENTRRQKKWAAHRDREDAQRLARETKSTTRLAAELWLVEIQRDRKVA